MVCPMNKAILKNVYLTRKEKTVLEAARLIGNWFVLPLHFPLIVLPRLISNSNAHKKRKEEAKRNAEPQLNA
jgi:hypothetical protein